METHAHPQFNIISDVSNIIKGNITDNMKQYIKYTFENNQNVSRIVFNDLQKIPPELEPTQLIAIKLITEAEYKVHTNYGSIEFYSNNNTSDLFYNLDVVSCIFFINNNVLEKSFTYYEPNNYSWYTHFIGAEMIKKKIDVNENTVILFDSLLKYEIENSNYIIFKFVKKNQNGIC